MEYKLDIELLTGWWSLGGFQLGYKHDVNRVIDETRKLIKNPVSGYQTDEKLQECNLFLSRVKTAVLQHEWGPNCNDKEKHESIALIDSFVEEIEGLKSIWAVEARKEEHQQHERKNKSLHKILNTDEAKRLFDNAIQYNLILPDAEGYEWVGGTKELLAYFAERMSNKLSLSSKLDKDGNNTINWKVFENLFGIPKIKDAKYSWLKLNTKFTPNGYDKIDKVFD